MEKDTLTQLICKICGGPLRDDGVVLECLACGAKYESRTAKSQNEVMLYNAFDDLRKGEFEEAEESFSRVIFADSDCHEAYWGRALARAGVLFVDDVDSKKVPTCHRISESSFLQDKDYLAAIEHSVGEVKDNYVRLGEKIEKIRTEWLFKASKEKPYDIFICYKDSDSEKGIERTKDSYEAQNLYTYLTQAGYRVFFSRESLRDKIAEQYEPYIFNAIKTARVMIVYAQNPDYVTSAWVKNEWRRYAKLLAEGEKHSASLVVVYENFDPSLLPSSLKNRQCLDGSKKTFLGDLLRHIEKVFEETTSTEGNGIEKISLKSGRVLKRAKEVATKQLEQKSLNLKGIDLSLSEKKQLAVVKTMAQNGLFDEASALLDSILKANPDSAEALMYKLFVNRRCMSVSDFIKSEAFPESDKADEIISKASKDFAVSALDIFYGLAANLVEVNEKDALSLLDAILPYSYENSKANVEKIMKAVSMKVSPSLFEKVICAVDSSDVDLHIRYLYEFAVAALYKKQYSVAKMYFSRVLKIDAGYTDALRGIIRTTSLSQISPSEVRYDRDIALPNRFKFDEFEALLISLDKVGQQREITAVLDALYSAPVTANCVETFNHVIRYYPSDVSEIDGQLTAMTDACMKAGFFDSAVYYLKLRLEYDKENPKVFWQLIKAKAKASTDSELERSGADISAMPEFVNFLAVADDRQTQNCMRIVKNAKNYQAQNQGQNRKDNNPPLNGTGVEKGSTLYKVQKKWDEARAKNESQKQKVSIAPYVLTATLLFMAFAACFVVTIVAETQNKFLGGAFVTFVLMLVFAVLSIISLVVLRFRIKKYRDYKLNVVNEQYKNEKFGGVKNARMQIIRASESATSAVGFFMAVVLALVIFPSAITRYENIFEFNEKRLDRDDDDDERYEFEFDDDFDIDDYFNSRGLKLKR